ncbi:MAG TPA: phage integrase SAM-like domain-containing protein [Haliscomenobacter sp.]|nr:phage integrase SAM-like domain-containing protein [Haliscomenobacter sp.]
MNIRFNLRDKQAKDKSSIILIVRHYQKTLKLVTGLHITPTLWDAKTNKPRRGQLPHVRVQLDQLATIAEKVLSGAGYLEQSDFTKLMNEAMGKTAPSKTPYLLEFIAQYCEENQRTALKSTATTLFNFVTNSKLERWGQIDFKKAQGRDVRFDAIDWNFREKFYRYCLTNGLNIAYTQAKLKHLAQFINEARKRGHHSNAISLESGFQGVKNAAKQLPVTLNLEELNRLASLPLTGQDEKIRDLFLIGVFTGQRFSDYSSIKPNQVKGGGVFFRQQKTKALVEIDLDMFTGLVPQSLGDLLAKYGNQSPALTRGNNGSVVFNRSIKFLCRRAGITTKVEWITTNGGIYKTEILEKWQVVSSHCCRRSFATLWAKMGLPLADIASATGHTTEKQLMEYIGLSHEEKRDKRRVAVDAIKAKQQAI